MMMMTLVDSSHNNTTNTARCFLRCCAPFSLSLSPAFSVVVLLFSSSPSPAGCVRSQHKTAESWFFPLLFFSSRVVFSFVFVDRKTLHVTKGYREAAASFIRTWAETSTTTETTKTIRTSQESRPINITPQSYPPRRRHHRIVAQHNTTHSRELRRMMRVVTVVIIVAGVHPNRYHTAATHMIMVYIYI